jgi:glycine cleavage system H protein
MASVRGCNFPDDLYYNLEHNVWLRREADGQVTIGMTAYACALSGEIVSYLPKSVGKLIDRDKSVSTVESGKWVGPVKTPLAGEITAVNEAAVMHPGLVNQAPYGAGWVATLRPSNWAGEADSLITGAEVVAAFEAKMAADGFGGCGE